ncbi:hypothetical protein [Brevibacillus invocatus]|nr:hypothetical protein [Brevibacillus invocatus]
MLHTQELEKVIQEEMQKNQLPGLAIAAVHKRSNGISLYHQKVE